MQVSGLKVLGTVAGFVFIEGVWVLLLYWFGDLSASLFARLWKGVIEGVRVLLLHWFGDLFVCKPFLEALAC